VKRFKYKLEAVLTLRKQAQQAALERYARALAEEHQLRAGMSRIDEELEQLIQALRQQLTASPCMESVRAIHQAQELVADRRHDQAQALQESQSKSTELMKEFIDAKQEADRMVGHQDQQKQDHQREQDQLEQKLMDDLINQRFRLAGSVTV